MLESDAETERKTVAILKVLSESLEPLGSISIARALENHGIYLNERTVRYHLRLTDARGFTQPLGRDGRMLTRRGHDELTNALAPEQVGFVIERIASLAFQTTLDPATATGEVIINTSLFAKDKFKKALSAMKEAFSGNVCVSDLVAVADEGEKLGTCSSRARWIRHHLQRDDKRRAPESGHPRTPLRRHTEVQDSSHAASSPSSTMRVIAGPITGPHQGRHDQCPRSRYKRQRQDTANFREPRRCQAHGRRLVSA
jgi:predicted transcriptional regulator